MRIGLTFSVFGAIAAAFFLPASSTAQENDPAVQLGPRPFYLVDDMDEGELKTSLQPCEKRPFYRTTFSIGHRGAPMQFPSTRGNPIAAARAWARASSNAT